MGGQTSKSQPSKNEYFSSFGSFDRSGEELLICRRGVAHRKIRQAWQNLIVELRNIPNDHIMVPKDWSVIENSMCGNGEIVEIQYENYSGNLQELIAERGASNKHFEESEIWYVIYALSEVGLNCRSLGQRVGDIRPKNILMNKEGQIKVMTFLSFPNELSPFSDHSSRVFFAPEELDQRKKGYMQSTCDAVKSESFSLGMTVLSMVLLQDIDHLYDYFSNQFHQKLLEKEMAKMRGITYHSLNENKNYPYSPYLCRAVQLLLALNHQQRLGYTHLYRQLQPHLQSIEQFQPFQINLEVLEEKAETEENQASKEVITLRSRKRKVRVETYETTQKKNAGYQGLPVSYAPIVESRYASIDHSTKQTPIAGSNTLLQSIDEKLKRSREEFPS